MVMIIPIISIISLALILINILLAKKEFNEREKPSPFECGFDPISSARLPFSIQFFLIAIIFLIFDIELTLILPSITNLFSMNLMFTCSILTLFVMILLIGLYIEWKQGALEWYI
uniref:NADH-ubiquinone oxidoreductase chain 3 n=1 Tax=Mesaphorura yosii TaxID=1840514 RepID=A0A6H0EWU7_9HEXA|nr:NADH dehydrogenase subunit 3 [Mesaphorura yosii]